MKLTPEQYVLAAYVLSLTILIGWGVIVLVNLAVSTRRLNRQAETHEET